MAELRVYVHGHNRFRTMASRALPDIDVHMITGPHRMCSIGFWCPKCHPQIELRVVDPDTGERIKTLYMPDAKFTVPGIR